MAQFDIESFRDYFVGLLQAGMAAKVAEINTEKGDSLLEDIPAAQYVSSFNETVMNYDFVLYNEIAEIRTLESHPGGISREITLFFSVVFMNMDDWTATEKRILRYARAMEEIIQAGQHPAISDFEIDVAAPNMIQLSEKSPIWQAGGIQIKGVITT
jgi:hypothetical protein